MEASRKTHRDFLTPIGCCECIKNYDCSNNKIVHRLVHNLLLLLLVRLLTHCCCCWTYFCCYCCWSHLGTKFLLDHLPLLDPNSDYLLNIFLSTFVVGPSFVGPTFVVGPSFPPLDPLLDIHLDALLTTFCWTSFWTLF